MEFVWGPWESQSSSFSHEDSSLAVENISVAHSQLQCGLRGVLRPVPFFILFCHVPNLLFGKSVTSKWREKHPPSKKYSCWGACQNKSQSPVTV